MQRLATLAGSGCVAVLRNREKACAFRGLGYFRGVYRAGSALMARVAGLDAVIRDAIAEGVPAEPEPVQFGLDLEAGRLPVGEDAARRGAIERRNGRPPGAENLSTRQWRELLLRKGSSPLLLMMRWAQLSPEEIAERLGITAKEAFDRQMVLWDRLAPYLHARMAPVDESGKAVAALAINITRDAGSGPMIGADGEAVPPWMRHEAALMVDDVEYQRVSTDGDAPSHGEASHDHGQAIGIAGQSRRETDD